MRWTMWRTIVGLPLFLYGCVLDIPPERQPLDMMWMERMLAARYGSWANGVEIPPSGVDEIRSFPVGAKTTRYGISIDAERSFGWGGWSFSGGMIGRVAVGSATVELFGKRVSRVHGPKGTASLPDRSYEFFLVVRPTGAGPARVVKEWRFSWEELAPTVAPEVAEKLKRQYAGAALERELEREQIVSLDGNLAVDPNGKVGTVTITGLKRPFQERVDLSREI